MAGRVAVPFTKSPDRAVSYRSLPHKLQLAILCLARLADPLALTSVNSYIYFMIKFLKPAATPSDIAVYVGVIVTAKTAGKVCTGLFWGRLSDSPNGGRKLVLVIGVLSSGISSIGFGFSRSIAAAVFWQFFGSAMSSNIGILRTIIADMYIEKRTRSRALLLLPLVAGIGQFLGPLLGGFLSSTATSGLFATYPYALPNLVIAASSVVAAMGVILFVDETLESHDANDQPWYSLWVKLRSRLTRSQRSDTYRYSTIGTEAPILLDDTPTNSPIVSQSPSFSNDIRDTTRSSRKELAQPTTLTFWQIWTTQVLATLLSQFIIIGHTGTFTALWVVFLSTPVVPFLMQSSSSLFAWSGGLGLSTASVGVLMSALAGAGVLVQMFIYPWLSDRFSTIRILRATLVIYPLMYVLAPLPALVASHFASEGAGIDGTSNEGAALHQRAPAVIVVVAVVLGLQTVGRMGVLPGLTLLINECVPAQSARGTINTAGTTVGNLSKCIFPPLAMVLYGWGLDHGVVGTAFWALSGMAVIAIVASFWVKDESQADHTSGQPHDVESSL